MYVPMYLTHIKTSCWPKWRRSKDVCRKSDQATIDSGDDDTSQVVLQTNERWTHIMLAKPTSQMNFGQLNVLRV